MPSFGILVCLLLINASVVLADVEIGNIKIKDDGKLIFSDNSEQSTATLKGDKGDKGDSGAPGSQVTRDAMCQVYSTEGLPLPPFCAKKTIFLTSSIYNGNLGGLSGADAKCQSASDAGGLAGTYKAWLSDSATSAKNRLTHNPSPYVRTDGATVANNWFDLTDGWLKEPVICDEFKSCQYVVDFQQVNSGLVLTGTSKSGNFLIVSGDCSGWTSSEGNTSGGYYGSIDMSWTHSLGQYPSCSWTTRLYCIEQ